jgi:hypothetical protein
MILVDVEIGGRFEKIETHCSLRMLTRGSWGWLCICRGWHCRGWHCRGWLLPFIPASGMLLSMTSVSQTGSGMLSARAGRCLPKSDFLSVR